MTSRLREERGFTLIELMVVVMIIAILIAVGLPTFVGARERAAERAVQGNVRNAFTATRVFYNESLVYTSDTTAMQGVEPSLTWTTAVLDGSQSSTTIGLKIYDIPDAGQTVIVVGRTHTGHCFYLRDVMGGATAGTYYDRDVAPGGTCPYPVDPSTVSAPAWTR